MSHQDTPTAGPAAVDWRQRAACRDEDPELFFPLPSGYMAQHMQRVRAICDPCPVRVQCLQFALDVEAGARREDRHGIFAGTTPHQRWAMWRCTTGRCEHPHHKTLTHQTLHEILALRAEDDPDDDDID